jgi:hypothetical protein
MPKLEMHFKESLERTGKEYRDLHGWIDDPPNKPEHHDVEKIYHHAKVIEKKWGEEGAQEFLHHLQMDMKAQVSRIQDDIKNVLGYFGIKL